MMLSFKECGDCYACCNGNLYGNSYGNIYDENKPCVFLVHKTCSIYKDRPKACHDFQCAWTQDIFKNEDMRPDKCGLLISVETDKENKQYLLVTQFKPIIEYRHYKTVEEFCEKNATYYKLTRVGN